MICGGMTPRLGLLTAVAGLGGFLFGYDTGIVSGAMLFIAQEYELTPFWHELIVSITIASAAIFALIGGRLCDLIGRRRVIALAAAVFATGSCLLAFAHSPGTLLVGRFILGIAIGLVSMAVPIYLAECAPAPLRGAMVTFNNYCIILGQFVAYMIALLLAKNEENGWRWMLGLGAVPGVIQLLGISLMPETPRYLLGKGRGPDAAAVLAKLRAEADDVEGELNQLRTSIEADQQEGTISEMLSTPTVRRALLVGCGLQAFQQLVGINTVMYYSASIVQMAGIQDKARAVMLSAGVSALYTMFALLGLFLVDNLGRRILLIASNTGVLVGLLMLSLSFHVISVDSPPINLSGNVTTPCSRYTICEDCTSSPDCGMCFAYSDESPTLIGQASCDPVDQSGTGESRAAASGRCAAAAAEEDSELWFAHDYCPSPYAAFIILSLIVYLCSFGPGFGCIPWVVNSEIYPQWARSKGNSLSTFTNWSCNLLVSLSFLTLTHSLTRAGAFGLYAGFALLSLLFVAAFLPETSGVPLENIETLFEKEQVVDSAVVYSKLAEDSPNE